MRRIASGLVALTLGSTTALASPPATPKSQGHATSSDADLHHVRLDRSQARAQAGGGEIGLTLDPELQREVERILEKAKAPSGAIVMSDVRTGRVLAYATRGDEGDLVRQAHFPGASLFKVVTAATLLESHVVRPGDVECFGGGESRLREADVLPGCHPGDQKTRFDKALGKSINGVFARLALKHLEPTGLDTMARSLGMADAPPFDLAADKSFVKLPADKLGFARAAAGFGDAKVSPLSALFMMQTIANGGERIRLHVTGSPDAVPRVSLGRAISKETATELTRMLEVTTRAGTSRKAFRAMDGRPRLRVAGKTGTLALEQPKRLVSWFAGFAPSNDPEIAISVLLANDEKWWRKGNEVARDALDAYFRDKKGGPKLEARGGASARSVKGH
jgi:cell division protein FtsI/penicillin-binding protein 2